MTSHPSRHRRPAAALLAAVLALGGCVRLDTPPPTHPTLDAAQEARQEAALAAARIAEAAHRVAAADPAAAPLLETLAAHAEAQRDALGGVWVAWPEGPPEGVPTPDPSPTSAPEVVDTAGVLALVEADRAASGARASDPSTPREERALHVAITSARAAESAALAARLGVAPPPLATPSPLAAPAPPAAQPGPSPRDGGEPTPPVPSPTFPGTEDAQALALLDAARFGLETAAARSGEPVRTAAATEARTLARATDAMVAAGVDDTRRAAWASGDVGTQPDAGAMAREALAPLLELWTTAAVRSAGTSATGTGPAGGAPGTDPAPSTDPAVHVDGAQHTAALLVVLGAGLDDATLGPLPAVAPRE